MGDLVLAHLRLGLQGPEIRGSVCDIARRLLELAAERRQPVLEACQLVRERQLLRRDRLPETGQLLGARVEVLAGRSLDGVEGHLSGRGRRPVLRSGRGERQARSERGGGRKREGDPGRSVLFAGASLSALSPRSASSLRSGRSMRSCLSLIVTGSGTNFGPLLFWRISRTEEISFESSFAGCQTQPPSEGRPMPASPPALTK